MSENNLYRFCARFLLRLLRVNGHDKGGTRRNRKRGPGLHLAVPGPFPQRLAGELGKSRRRTGSRIGNNQGD